MCEFNLSNLVYNYFIYKQKVTEVLNCKNTIFSRLACKSNNFKQIFVCLVTMLRWPNGIFNMWNKLVKIKCAQWVLVLMR